MVANFLISGKLSGFGAAEGVNIVRRGEIISGSKKVFVSLFFFSGLFTSWLYVVFFTVVSIFSLILFPHIYILYVYPYFYSLDHFLIRCVLTCAPL